MKIWIKSFEFYVFWWWSWFFFYLSIKTNAITENKWMNAWQKGKSNMTFSTALFLWRNARLHNHVADILCPTVKLAEEINWLCASYTCALTCFDETHFESYNLCLIMFVIMCVYFGQSIPIFLSLLIKNTQWNQNHRWHNFDLQKYNQHT